MRKRGNWRSGGGGAGCRPCGALRRPTFGAPRAVAAHRMPRGPLDAGSRRPPGRFPAWSRRAHRRADLGQDSAQRAPHLRRGDRPPLGLPRALRHRHQGPRQHEPITGDDDASRPALELPRRAQAGRKRILPTDPGRCSAGQSVPSNTHGLTRDDHETHRLVRALSYLFGRRPSMALRPTPATTAARAGIAFAIHEYEHNPGRRVPWP